MPAVVLTGDRDRDLAAVAQRAGRAILASVPSLPEGMRRVLRESVNARTLWTLAIYLGAWAYRSKSLRLAQLVSDVPALSGFLSQSADFARFERDLMLADNDAGLEIAGGSFARAAAALDPRVLVMLLRMPVWKRLELALSAIPVDSSIAGFFEPERTAAEPRAESTGSVRERSRARRFDMPIFEPEEPSADTAPEDSPSRPRLPLYTGQAPEQPGGGISVTGRTVRLVSGKAVKRTESV